MSKKPSKQRRTGVTDTEYLLRSPTNAARLAKSIEQLRSSEQLKIAEKIMSEDADLLRELTKQ